MLPQTDRSQISMSGGCLLAVVHVIDWVTGAMSKNIRQVEKPGLSDS